MNANATEHRDVYLTIVPHELDLEAEDALDTIVDRTDEASLEAPVVPAEETFTMEPAPARRRSPLLLAGAMGGGMIVGGGVVGFLGALALVGLTAVGGAAWWYTSLPETELEAAPIEAPLADEAVEEVGADEGTDEAEVEAEAVEAPEADASAPAPAERRSAPTPAPEAPVYSAPPVQQAAPARPAPEEMPADDVTVKLLSDPPAASVTVDGVPMGRTPLKTELPIGTHTVVIESGKASGSFTINAGSAERFCFGSKGRKVFETPCN
jgi:hypothetical protein